MHRRYGSTDLLPIKEGSVVEGSRRGGSNRNVQRPHSMPTQVAQDRLGDHLVSEGLITELQLREALTDARDHNTRVGFALVKLGFLAEEEITRMLARQYRVPAVDLDRVTVEEKIARLIPGEVAFKHLVLPLRRVGRTLTVAMANPSDLGAIDDVKFITRLEVEPVVVGESRSTTTRPTTGWRRSSAT